MQKKKNFVVSQPVTFDKSLLSNTLWFSLKHVHVPCKDVGLGNDQWT